MAASPALRDRVAFRIIPVAGRALGRSALVALARGARDTRRTVMLTGHFDTVPTSDYGALEPWATEPDELLPRLIGEIERTGIDRQAEHDLRSGRFLPGRGLLDMKSGLAAGIAALEAFVAVGAGSAAGNVLFCAVPDEEDSSVGMRAVARALPAYLAEQGLDLALAVNLDALGDEGDGTAGRVVALGAI